MCFRLNEGQTAALLANSRVVCLQLTRASTVSDEEVSLLSPITPLFVSHHLSHQPPTLLYGLELKHLRRPFTLSPLCRCQNASIFNHPLLSPHRRRPPSQLNVTALDWSQLSKKVCLKYGGSLVGKSCSYVPDLALMSFILFFGTYSMTISLKKFKFSRYFPTKVTRRPACLCLFSD